MTAPEDATPAAEPQVVLEAEEHADNAGEEEKPAPAAAKTDSEPDEDDGGDRAAMAIQKTMSVDSNEEVKKVTSILKKRKSQADNWWRPESVVVTASQKVTASKSVALSMDAEFVEGEEGSEEDSEADSGGQDMLPMYTTEQVKQHNTAQDCWLIIHDNVYDVSGWVQDHPGGPGVMMSRAGKNAGIHFDNVGHSQRARDMMDAFLIGKVLNNVRRYSAPEVLPSSWHETRRAAMLRGRHGKLIQQWHHIKDNWIVLYGVIHWLCLVGTAFLLGYYDCRLHVLLFLSVTWGSWNEQGVHVLFHEASHSCTSIDFNTFHGFLLQQLPSMAIMADWNLYYGPFHSVHHKYLGVSGRKSFLKALIAKHPISEYPDAERSMRIDLNIEVEGYFAYASQSLAQDEGFDPKTIEWVSPLNGNYLFPLPQKLKNFAEKPGFLSGCVWVLVHTMGQFWRKFIREALIVPILAVVYTILAIKHVIQVDMKSDEQRAKSTGKYVKYVKTLWCYYVGHLTGQVFWLTLFYYLPDHTGHVRDPRTGTCVQPNCGDDPRDPWYNFWNLFFRYPDSTSNFWVHDREDGRPVNWQSWMYLHMCYGMTTRYNPCWSLIGPMWCNDHTGYAYERDEDESGANTPNTCQATRSSYGWASYIVLSGMNYHCEHHDIPRIPQSYLPQLKKVYPEFYDHLKSYPFYWDNLVEFLQNRHKKVYFAACA